jgi:DNA-binding response OmpR family regulator
VPLKRILLVEDDADVRFMMEHVLLANSYDVDPVSTVTAARTRLERQQYDLLLLDGLLPDGTGLEIAAEAEERGIPLIIITAYAFRLPHDQLARYELLLKPLRPAELLKTVERSIGKCTCA